MIIRLKDILGSLHQFDFTFGSNWWKDEVPNDQVLGLDGPLDVHLTISKEGSQYVVDGSLSGRVRVRCDRCLESFSHKVDSDFRLLLAPSLPEPVGNEIELVEDDMSVDFVADDAIEIDQLVREQLYLSLPIKFLCHETCRGLCSVCGTNLNQEECTCHKRVGHSAFLKLKELGFKSD